MKQVKLFTLIISLIGLGLCVRQVRAQANPTCVDYIGVINSTCTLSAQASDPEGDAIYYVFDWGDGTANTRVPTAGFVASGTQVSADHTWPNAGTYIARVFAYDEANHISPASVDVHVTINTQSLSATLTGLPDTAGWYNYSAWGNPQYTATCTAGSGFDLTVCQTQVSINNGPWTNINNPTIPAGQSTWTYQGTYTFPTDGASYRFRTQADDTSGTPGVATSELVPASGQIQIDKSPPFFFSASSPAASQTPFLVTVPSVVLQDYPNPSTGPNSCVNPDAGKACSWDIQYKYKTGSGAWSAWTNCRINYSQSITSINFGAQNSADCDPVVNLVPNTRYCFRARGRDSAAPTPNEQGYTAAADGDTCTDYQVSNPPIAPYNPSPASGAIVSANASNVNLRWFSGDDNPLESLNFSTYISPPNQKVNVPADLDGQLSGQIPCASPGCQYTYGPPRLRAPLQAGATYQWRVQVSDGFNTVDSTPLPWTFKVNRPPVVKSVTITPSVVNTSATISWQVSDQDLPAQTLFSHIYYGSSPGATTNLISSGLTTANCTGGPNSSGWNCSYTWNASCAAQILSPGQYITIIASDGLDNSVPVSSSATFTINHTETRYYPTSGYESDVTNGEQRTFAIEAGSIEPGSAFVSFRGACNNTVDPTVDANAEGNIATCAPCSLADGNVSELVPLYDLIPGQTNTLNFTVQGCGFTDYRITYNHVTACDQPYLGVEQGSIYSQGNIRAQYSPPEGNYNATYQVLGGGTIAQPRVIENFITGPAPFGPSAVDPSFGPMIFPGVTSDSSPRVSSFDYYSLTHNLAGDEVKSDSTNAYGHIVQVFSNDLDDVMLQDVIAKSKSLGNRVYWVKDNLVVKDVVEFANGSDNESGAGLIIVDGDLIINSNMFYQPPAPGLSARNLASVGWLVMGNIIIDPSVSQIVGAYFAASSKTGGVFSTGSGPQQLIIYGAVIAKQLQLERTASANGEPSEKVVADGRVLLNTPPGFVDIMSTLPTWRFRTP